MEEMSLEEYHTLLAHQKVKVKGQGRPADTHLEDNLLALITLAGLPRPVTQFRFHPRRRWRSDLAWPEQKLLVEVEGGIYADGRHVRGTGYEGDCEKYNEAALLGYTVLRVTAGQIESGAAVQWIERALTKQELNEG